MLPRRRPQPFLALLSASVRRPTLRAGMSAMRMPKPARWAVVGAWATVAWFRPEAAAGFLLVMIGVAILFALLGAYARSLQRRQQPPPWVCQAMASTLRRCCSPRRLVLLGAAGCFVVALLQLPSSTSGWVDPAWVVTDPYASRDHAAPGGPNPASAGPAAAAAAAAGLDRQPGQDPLAKERWSLIAAAYDVAVSSQWRVWEVGGGEASARRAAAEWHAFLAHVPPSPQSVSATTAYCTLNGHSFLQFSIENAERMEDFP